MPDSAETAAFIKDSFRSVWSLELLLLLRSDPLRTWLASELVEHLRGSELIVRQSIQQLVAGGLVLVQEDGGVRYGPASPDLESLVEKSASLYARRPDAVRRMIVLAANDQLAAFADAFRLRKD